MLETMVQRWKVCFTDTKETRKGHDRIFMFDEFQNRVCIRNNERKPLSKQLFCVGGFQHYTRVSEIGTEFGIYTVFRENGVGSSGNNDSGVLE
jgi:hypothetical protein